MSSRYRISPEEGILVLPWGATEDVTFVRGAECQRISKGKNILRRGGSSYMLRLNLIH